MLMHMNFGSKGGAATYEIFDNAGHKMSIGYQYDTCKGGLTGFSLEDVKGVMSWKELVAAWPAWIAERKNK